MPDETIETRRPWRGSPRPCFHAGAFLFFLGIISTVSKSLRYALLLKCVYAPSFPGLRTLRCGRVLSTCALPLSLRFATKILYEIMLLGFLCPTKPSKRAVHGAILIGICPFHNDFYFFIHRNPFFIFSQFYFYLFQTTLHLSCSKSHLHNLTNLCFAVPPRFL